ncbi:MarR family transcriptional regulator [Eoetvoesiella caeni]|uniref:MarR family transcriptional regulator n=2 Tax=Eoetvoesiella caeni TaxID=645616 RepID=A0A366HIG9_9BURK|nr:MarR family transcriptional regulator [Eoetvoesiella caeni]
MLCILSIRDIRYDKVRGKMTKVHKQSMQEAQADDHAFSPLEEHGLFDNDTVAEPFSQGLWSRPGFLVRRLNQIHYAMFFEECKEENVTPVQYGILTVLAANPWLDQTAIGYEVGLDRTTSADVIKRLEEKGLLERRINPMDRRSRQAAVTPEGLRVMALLKQGMARAQQRLLDPLSLRDRKIFMSLLVELVDANNQYGRAVLKSV